MEAIEFYYFPLDPPDHLAISSVIRQRAIFVPSFSPSEEDIYDPVTYRRQEAHHGTATHLLADRNFVTRWVSLAAGSPATDEQHRLAAAVMAFAQCSHVLIEPNIALYEAATTADSTEANRELHFFRMADNVHPASWTDVALGRSNELEVPVDLPHTIAPKQDVDFAMPLRRWRRLYVLALKLAELELRGGSPLRRMEELLQ